MLSCFRLVQLLTTSWTVAQQTALSMEFSRKEYWNGLPFPPPGDLPDPGIEPISPALQVDSFTTEPPGKPFYPVRRNKLKKKKRNTECWHQWECKIVQPHFCAIWDFLIKLNFYPMNQKFYSQNRQN